MHDKTNENMDKAVLNYKDGEFEIILPGSYVICAISGERIPLDRLYYWSVDRREAYANAEMSLKAEKMRK
ncbi:DUF2093 domain-containing protein [Candidatus Liberibacter americanus]|uniref:DUF2093 domain-containing protein n=1 Tax=Candidatus Liberibacter americanus str. Sao Paulo TaxID=1261131 RepID=U6B400_9HYPH|nr:DUF2093 domain-containing protein [Candidatus Liberibacter americanus]AHA27665.1 hypothetical protein lam_294 [Candidatus Liberibacter americanus str. Sao Paulo]EMS36374.1 hypothetical protein G653_01823 [Candidatus Liberibacter americanus PW_SP]